jgi:hypothetical protein
MRARLAATMAVLICASVAGTALADGDDHHHSHGRWGYELHHRGWHGHHRRVVYPSRPDVYYYAPPPVIYTPAYPSPGITFIFPLHIR